MHSVPTNSNTLQSFHNMAGTHVLYTSNNSKVLHCTQFYSTSRKKTKS